MFKFGFKYLLKNKNFKKLMLLKIIANYFF